MAYETPPLLPSAAFALAVYGEWLKCHTGLSLTFSNGILTGRRESDNTKTHISVFLKHPDSLSTFIYTHINWQSIPCLEDQKVVVAFRILSTDSQRPKITFIREKVSDSLFNREAYRVVRMLPDWNTFYREGKLLQMAYILPVIFSEEKRRQYAPG